ncbi:NAF1-domain-containing protein [Punctularia strigosozonata HHB-11173 SS5]|uniref:NAF1-domain-containing protein n=1 Tax=Punctularia strigosozonata (strain HHB-11173) TaxID=741275 RepID=UPI0004417D5E|nr:NAF1-domain-containing protein [Punctularia strigosozonata HHB-11173 SS5]EIN13920.1 NAF1-domain-containing protein [Punctularia strigosozonata HHB-11173 SS5]
MDNVDGFKAPSTLPQDLLLINELIGEIPPPPAFPKGIREAERSDEDIASSNGDVDSEDEVEARLKCISDHEDTDPLDSDLEDDSSSSDSESDQSISGKASHPGKRANIDLAAEDEDGEDSGLKPQGYLKTQHEITELAITIPEASEVPSDEELEKVGEVMTVLPQTVVIKGIPAPVTGRASEKALDSETLLVLEDRRVLGYIYETFGPTHQPLYQVQFNDSYPLVPGKVQVSQPVFHVPRRSHFVFLNELKHSKGSDASNIHDEEPAAHELDFSDDEEEAAFKRAAKMKRRRSDSRAGSVIPSRHTTPTPSQMRDQDLAGEPTYDGNPYDQFGPYDGDAVAGPSRAAPLPYDDPYSDVYGTDIDQGVPSSEPPTSVFEHQSHFTTTAVNSCGEGPFEDSQLQRAAEYSRDRDAIRGRGRGRGQRREDNRPRGNRGRGVNRDSRRDVRHTSSNRGPHLTSDTAQRAWGTSQRQQTYAAHAPGMSSHRPLSPTSQAIARATGQYLDVHGPTNVQQPTYPANDVWIHQSPFSYGQQLYYQQPHVDPFIQPHINPRFAASFGMGHQYGLGSPGHASVGRGWSSSAWSDSVNYEVQKDNHN